MQYKLNLRKLFLPCASPSYGNIIITCGLFATVSASSFLISSSISLRKRGRKISIITAPVSDMIILIVTNILQSNL